MEPVAPQGHYGSQATISLARLLNAAAAHLSPQGARSGQLLALLIAAPDSVYVARVTGWNHNTHHHARLLRHLPASAESALDVGCGDGAFAALLGARFREVVALDTDPEQVAAAAVRCASQPNVRVLQADFLTSRLPAQHFDVVTALASFHHMPFTEAIGEAQRVLKPGGRLVVLGVWTDGETPGDLAWNMASAGLNLLLRKVRGPDVMTAPATLERTSWREARRAAGLHLPHARLRRHLLWRYSLVWQKPRDEASGTAAR